jgi:type II secretory pathway pseudopilin PulG
MSTKRHLVKATTKFLQKISKQCWTAIKKQIIWLLRTVFQVKKRGSYANAGFVLPTVAMVALVVVLLTTAILFRSFERSKNASNVRVNEAVLNAAAPAIDRAKSKLNKLLSDPTLPRATPTDTALDGIFKNATKLNEYTLGDETQLKLTLSTSEKAKRTETEEKNKEVKSAWMYPVDTDNNGKFDSYTIYGIYFTNPPVTNGTYKYARNPLEARTPPMVGGGAGDACKDTIGTSATLVGSSGWFKVGSKLKKAFFVYTANVPITNTQGLSSDYEPYKGNKGFSAIEYQQERVQLPLVNNAVVYEDDLEITPGPKLNLNGRIITNSNLITGSGFEQVTLYQVSSPHSCFYEADNAKIIVAGNVGAGTFTSSGDLTNPTLVHLFNGKGNAPHVPGANPSYNKTISGASVEIKLGLKDTKSVNHVSADLAYNSLAFVKRINRLVEAQMANAESTDPQEVKDRPVTKTRREMLELYFKKRTRRVPYAEVGFNSTTPLKVGTTDYASVSPLEGSGDSLRPKDPLVFPFNPSNGTNKTDYANLDLNKASGVTDRILPPATEPNKLEKEQQGNETFVGDRVSVGNNLPELWWDSTKNKFVSSDKDDTQAITSHYWDNPDNPNTTNTSADNVRTRRSRIQQLADLGDIGRDGEWELAAAKVPAPQEPAGGLRVITGAGIYLPAGATAATTDFSTYSTQIWPDSSPAKYDTVPAAIKPFDLYGLNIQYEVPQPPANTPYLRMRATAVYHYKGASYNATTPTPIACVSSYYDPTNSTTAKNISTLPAWASNPSSSATGGKSNNGIVYGPPASTSLTTYQNLLNYQAQLTYPNGRWVNEPLKNALAKTAANRTLSDLSAIDSALCALEIIDTATVKTPSDSAIPHGAIRETAFLDAREIQAIDAGNTPTGNYNLNKKDRRPLEIRATVLELERLRKKTIGSGPASTQEYLLPNSGIIYATRDDALADESAGTSAAQKLENPVDFKLDPTRRPNGIMLVKGAQLFRGDDNTYRDIEKGLILASNVPVYVKGDFNLHTQQEFGTPTQTAGYLADSWSNFYTRTAAQRNPDFACRPNDPRLPNCATGDEWRPAAVLADAVTLLSNSFREGFRNEGQYDWKPVVSTIPSPLSNDFSTVNSFVPEFKTNASERWYGSDGMPRDWVPDDATKPETVGFQASSYLNNFVTPVMKWIPAPELAIEICVPDPDLPAGSPCVWTLTTSNSGKPVGNEYPENQPANSIKTGTLANTSFLNTGSPFYGMPYRIAYVRDDSGNLVKDASGNLQVYGIENVASPPEGRTKIFSLINGSPFGAMGNVKVSTTKFIPFLRVFESGGNITYKPILQIDEPFTTYSNPNPASDPKPTGSNYNNNKIDVGIHGNWLPIATDTTFNLIIAAGDTPARPKEDNGGLHNFPRFIENWNPTAPVSAAQKARINGSFIQIKRSQFATAPYMVYLSDSSDGYAMTANLAGKIPYYLAPTRQWGYDVALLSQAPDRFAQKLVRIPDDLPDEYFREVGRDDAWVKSLLCAKKADDSFAINADQRPGCS